MFSDLFDLESQQISAFCKRMFSRAPNIQMIYVLVFLHYRCGEHMIICNICVYIYVYMVGHYVYIVYTSTYIGT